MVSIVTERCETWRMWRMALSRFHSEARAITAHSLMQHKDVNKQRKTINDELKNMAVVRGSNNYLEPL